MLKFLVAICIICSCPLHEHKGKGHNFTTSGAPADTLGDPTHIPPSLHLHR